jgi:hypothetical protein
MVGTPIASAAQFDLAGAAAAVQASSLQKFNSLGDLPNPAAARANLAVPFIAAAASLTGQTAAVSSVVTYTVAASAGAGSFRIGAYLTITAVSTDVIQLQVGYTDETGTARTVTLNSIQSGSPAGSFSGAGAYVFPTIDIRTSAGSVITVLTNLLNNSGSITYNVGATIQQVA